MAINPESQYPGKIAPSTPNYPYGQARNITVPRDGTGTPWEAALVNDLFGWQQRLLSLAGITPSGTPEDALASQYTQAISFLLNRVVDDYTDLRNRLTSGELVAGTMVLVRSIPGPPFKVEAIGGNVDDGGLVLTGGSLAAVRQYSGAINVTWFGVSPSASSSDNAANFQAAADAADNRLLYLPGAEGASASPYQIDTAIRIHGSLTGDGVRSSIIQQTDDSQGILIFDDRTDFFLFSEIQCTYEVPTNVQTTPGVILENESHNILVQNVLILGGSPGFHSDQVSFWQTYVNLRVQFADTSSIRIDGQRNDLTGAGTTINMFNCGCYNGNTGLLASSLSELNVQTFEVGTHDNHCFNLDNIRNAHLTCSHFEVNDFGGSFARALVLAASSNVHMEQTTSQDNTAAGSYYIVRAGDDAVIKLDGIYRSGNTNEELYYIQDTSITSDRYHYTFQGYGITDSETGTYVGGSTGIIRFPDYEVFEFNDLTDGNGTVAHNYPTVPAAMNLQSVNSFLDDDDLALTTSTSRFGSNFTSRLRNLSDGSQNTTPSIAIRSILRFSTE